MKVTTVAAVLLVIAGNSCVTPGATQGPNAADRELIERVEKVLVTIKGTPARGIFNRYYTWKLSGASSHD